MPVRLVDISPHELVVLKPAGVASELPRDPRADSLLTRLVADGYSGLRLVHRLDAPACGLMLVARSQTAAAHYAQAIEARRWQKWYVARVACAPETAARLVGPHKAYLRTAGRRAHVVRAGGKPSFLDVVLTAPVPTHPEHAHVLIRLDTGRFHQIRAMLAHVGAPLAGDVAYGGPPGTFYLEHVVLGAQRLGEESWMGWMAPPHPDRERWAPALSDAVETRLADILRTQA